MHRFSESRRMAIRLCFVNSPLKNEPHRDKINKKACAPSEDSDQAGRSEGSDQSGHAPGLVSVFAVRLKKARILSYH